MAWTKTALVILMALSITTPLRGQERVPDPGSNPEGFARGLLEAWSSGDVDRILSFYADDVVYEDVPSVDNGWDVPLRGKAALRQSLVDLFAAMPDFALEFESARATENGIVMEWTMTGTQTGDLPGLPATGRSISIRGISTSELEGARIRRNRDYYDAYLFLRQLGATPDLARQAENESVVRRFHEEVWNQGDLSAIDDLVSGDFVGHFPIGPDWRGTEALREQVRTHRTTFPDWREDVEEIVVEGDLVADLWTSTGTDRGGFRGQPPTDRRVEIHEFGLHRVVDGKIVEEWILPDLLSLYRQLGLLKEAAALR